jgi:hypothetical protein
MSTTKPLPCSFESLCSCAKCSKMPMHYGAQLNLLHIPAESARREYWARGPRASQPRKRREVRA